MKIAITLATVLVVAVAKPELYKEKEDFQYSRSSSDEGSKSGYYGAQRGNMGGNYERAHNMDNLAQNQMGGLVRQVNGEYGGALDSKTGSVFASANSRGIYGSGSSDLSNLQGRDFREGTSYTDSTSASRNSNYQHATSQNTGYHNGYTHESNQQGQGYYYGQNSDRASVNAATDNLSSGSSGHSGLSSQYHRESGYNSESGYQRNYGQRNSDLHGFSGYGSNVKSRLVSATPVRVLVRPGGRIVIPVAAQTYDATRRDSASIHEDNYNLNSEAADLNSIDSVGIKPTSTAVIKRRWTVKENVEDKYKTFYKQKMKKHKLLPNSVDEDWKHTHNLFNLQNNRTSDNTIHLDELINKLETKAQRSKIFLNNQTSKENFTIIDSFASKSRLLLSDEFKSEKYSDINEAIMEHLNLKTKLDIDVIGNFNQSNSNGRKRGKFSHLTVNSSNTTHTVHDVNVKENATLKNTNRQSGMRTDPSFAEYDSRNKQTNDTLHDYFKSLLILQPNERNGTIASEKHHINRQTTRLPILFFTDNKKSNVSPKIQTTDLGTSGLIPPYFNSKFEANKINASHIGAFVLMPPDFGSKNSPSVGSPIQEKIISTILPPDVTSFLLPVQVWSKKESNIISNIYLSNSSTAASTTALSIVIDKSNMSTSQNTSVASKKLQSPKIHKVLSIVQKDNSPKDLNMPVTKIDNNTNDLIRQSRGNNELPPNFKDLQIDVRQVNNELSTYLNQHKDEVNKLGPQKEWSNKLAEQYKKLIQESKNMPSGVVQKELERYMLQNALEKSNNQAETSKKNRNATQGWGNGKQFLTKQKITKERNSLEKPTKNQTYPSETQYPLVYSKLCENLMKNPGENTPKGNSLSNSILDYLITMNMQPNVFKNNNTKQSKSNTTKDQNNSKLKNTKFKIIETQKPAKPSKTSQETPANKIVEQSKGIIKLRAGPYKSAHNKFNKNLQGPLNKNKNNSIKAGKEYTQDYMDIKTQIHQNEEVDNEYPTVSDLLLKAKVSTSNYSDMDYTITSSTHQPTKKEPESSKNKSRFWQTVKKKVVSWFKKS